MAPQHDKIRQLLATLVKQAAATGDVGGYAGPSEDATAKVDNGTEPVSTGARAAEFATDTKALVPAAVTVDATADMSGEDGSQDQVQPNIGTSQSAIGEDPATEDNYKDKKDEPGSIGGETEATPLKYGTEKFSSWDLSRIQKELVAVGNRLLKSAAAPPAAATDANVAAAQAGYAAAALVGQEKQAAIDFILASQRDGELAADLTVRYLQTKLAKTANLGAGADAEDHSGPADTGSGAGPAAGTGADEMAMAAGAGAGGGDPAAAAPPAGGGESQEEILQAIMELLQENGIDPAQLEAMLAAGGAGGGGAPAMGGMPPEAAPPMGGEMGLPPMDPGMGGLPKAAALYQANQARQARLYQVVQAVNHFRKSGSANTPKARTNRVPGLKIKMANTLSEMLNRCY